MHTKERQCCRPRLRRSCTWQRRQQVTACFSLPPCIHNRHVTFADNVVIPVPRLRVDRLSDGAQKSEVRQIVLGHPVITLRHQGTDRCWGSVELVNLVFLTDLPEAARIGIGWHTFEHHSRRTIGQRAIDDIAVACDPPHISRTPEHIAIMVVECVLVSH